LSEQLESIHYFRDGDFVRALDGRAGLVRVAVTLFAIIGWDAGYEEEVDQFDPGITVIRRAGEG